MGISTRVLVADDSDTMRRVIGTLLLTDPAITLCGEAESYSELFLKLIESSPHIVLMDVRMPGATHFKPEIIKAKLCNASLLAMSLWNDEETSDIAESYGAIKLLDKADLTSNLLPAIGECMDQSRPWACRIAR